MDGPLDAVAARLTEASGWFRVVVGEPDGGGWHRLDPTLVADWLAALADGETGGHRDTAAAYFAGWLGGAVAAPVAMALITERRAWPLGEVRVRRDPGGWFDGLALVDDTVLVLPDDPDVGRPGVVVVPDLLTLRRRVAADVVAALTPMFAAVRAWAPFGTRGMWGSVADAIGAQAIGVDGGWEEAVRLVDATSAVLGAPIVRPARWTDGRTCIRGTCCLAHKVVEHCVTCPLIDEDERTRRLAEELTL